ncbi:hypothetical protein KJ693_10745 [bacterium]|nr:hypothetical protein [bacterium]MBU1615768.1 hypothetical protein [bacterium]
MQAVMRLPEKVSAEVNKISSQFGFRNEEEFVKEAVEDKILELKKRLFVTATDGIRSGLEKKGIKIEEVLEDFERQR